MQKYISELEDVHEEVVEALKRRMSELESELERTENYSSYYQVLNTSSCCSFCVVIVTVNTDEFVEML